VDPRADAVRTGYETVAGAYAHHLLTELDKKPLDRALLDVIAEGARGHRSPARPTSARQVEGRVLDVACGPGHVAAYLRDRGVDACGLDLSPAMIVEARRARPDVDYRVGDMFALPFEPATFAAAVAFYAIVHTPSAELEAPFRELSRVLRRGGQALVAFHVGDASRRDVAHVDEMWGCRTSLDFWFHAPERVAAALAAAGFTVEARVDRAPYADAEYPSRRTYLLGRTS
jgi:SAM-dependent methyltransferase